MDRIFKLWIQYPMIDIYSLNGYTIQLWTEDSIMDTVLNYGYSNYY